MAPSSAALSISCQVMSAMVSAKMEYPPEDKDPGSVNSSGAAELCASAVESCASSSSCISAGSCTSAGCGAHDAAHIRITEKITVMVELIRICVHLILSFYSGRSIHEILILRYFYQIILILVMENSSDFSRNLRNPLTNPG
jgi:hypothetical protein